MWRGVLIGRPCPCSVFQISIHMLGDMSGSDRSLAEEQVDPSSSGRERNGLSTFRKLATGSSIKVCMESVPVPSQTDRKSTATPFGILHIVSFVQTACKCRLTGLYRCSASLTASFFPAVGSLAISGRTIRWDIVIICLRAFSTPDVKVSRSPSTS